VNREYLRCVPLSINSKHVPIDACFRLFSASLRPDLDKIIFLDCDLVVQKSLHTLWNLDINNHSMAVEIDPGVISLSDEWSKKITTLLGENYKYRNTGVAVFNLKKWRNDNSEQKFFDVMDRHKDIIVFPDQDSLNILFKDSVLDLPLGWNAMPLLNRKIQDDAFINPSIIHWAGPNKPWNNPDISYAEVFWYYAKMTPFYEILIQRLIRNHAYDISNQLSQYINVYSSSIKYKLIFKYYLNLVLSKLPICSLQDKYIENCREIANQRKHRIAILRKYNYES
jgi:lipopolysaccharide biosynthesis glycosyltransferase